MILMRYLILPVLFLLSACGFQPVYGTQMAKGSVAAVMNSVDVGNIPNESGQMLRNFMLDQMYTSGSPATQKAYRIDFSNVRERRRSLGIAKDASVTRSQLELETTATLRRLSDDSVIWRRHLQAVSSYNVLGSQFSTLITRDDAREQALRELASNAVNQMELTFLRAAQ